MKRSSAARPDALALRSDIIGLGERSLRKSHFGALLAQHEALERFRTLLDNASEGIFLLELPSGRVLDVNASACADLGEPRQEVVGTALAMRLPRADAERLEALLGEARPGGPVERLDTTLRRATGEALPVEIAVRAVDFRGEAFAVAVARDVAERRAAEAALRRAKDAAEATERAKTEFLMVASHDLRTPLTVLALRVAASRRSLRAGVPVGERALAAMEEQIARLDRLSSGLLDVARLERGLLALDKRPVDLGAIVREVATDQRDHAPGRRIDLAAPEGPVPVVADADRVAQVVAGLLDNALRFSASDAPVSIAIVIADGVARVAVTDRGVGIAPERASRLFTRFGWGLGEATQHAVGLGLGLYVGREIARLHGGDLGFESAVGVGSTFTLALPLAP
jgi:two-component system CheB/CheR fusion protein